MWNFALRGRDALATAGADAGATVALDFLWFFFGPFGNEMKTLFAVN